MQSALVTLVGLARQKGPVKRRGDTGPALIEIFVALACCGSSMMIGLRSPPWSPRANQTMPILVGVTMVQVALSGGLFPLTGTLGDMAAIAPARWGLGAVAVDDQPERHPVVDQPGPNGQKPVPCGRITRPTG